MTQIGKADVERIAHLARLAIDPADVAEYERNLTAILGLVEQMGQVDTAAVAPMAHPLDQVQRLRADEVTEADCREALQAPAPALEQGLFLVPKVID
jgi:aspartyl-tRNA(Asn)/glutamyl-tRNA(Gln) amidotransferase subunit C